MSQRLQSFWKSYKYRFVPWLALNFKNRNVRRVGEGGGGDMVVEREEILHQLITLTTNLHHVSPPPHHYYHHHHHQGSAQLEYHRRALDVMERLYGFRVYRTVSQLGGLGVVAVVSGQGNTVADVGSGVSPVVNVRRGGTPMANVTSGGSSMADVGKVNSSMADVGSGVSLMANVGKGGSSKASESGGTNSVKVERTGGNSRTTSEYGNDTTMKSDTNLIGDGGRVLSDSDDGTQVVAVRRGQLVGLYPGSLYLPHQPIFFQSINNSFIFRCADGILIDGNDKRLSKLIYKSCSGRDQAGLLSTADTTWLTHHPINPLNVGQYVNNQSSDRGSNVAYQEVTLQPGEVRDDERRFLPNLWYRPPPHTPSLDLPLRIVALVATRDIISGEELLSDYFTVIS